MSYPSILSLDGDDPVTSFSVITTLQIEACFAIVKTPSDYTLMKMLEDDIFEDDCIEEIDNAYPLWTDSTQPNPIDYIFPGTNVDPFATYPSTLAPSIVQQGLSYRISIMTPVMLPTSGITNPYLQSWLPLSLSDSALFPALLLSSLTHRRARSLLNGESSQIFNEEDYQLEESYKETIKAINEAMRDPARVTADATILAVLMTIEAPTARGERLDWSHDSPFQAPLRGLQWLNIHGAREPHIAHQDGLCKLIQLRGGLQNIQLPGVAAAIFYRVLVNSTLTLSVPPLPFFPLSTLSTQSLIDISEAMSMKLDLCQLGFSSELAQVYHALAAYTATIERYIEGQTPTPNHQIMCDQRNHIQHSLMALPADCDGNSVYEAGRIAAIIYSIGVTFPLPGVRAPFSTLVGLLKAELQRDDVWRSWPSSMDGSRLLFWILTMGGIAATDTEQNWFIEVLAEIAQSCEWTETKKTLKVVLWLDSACDMAGKELWTRVYATREAAYKARSPCEKCRARKVKCDKGVPCRNCVKYGIECLPARGKGKPQVHVFSTRSKPCEICRRRKVRCDQQRPCRRCVDAGFDCL